MLPIEKKNNDTIYRIVFKIIFCFCIDSNNIDLANLKIRFLQSVGSNIIKKKEKDLHFEIRLCL